MCRESSHDLISSAKTIVFTMYPTVQDVEALEIPQWVDAFKLADHQEQQAHRRAMMDASSETIVFVESDRATRGDLFETCWSYGCGSNVFEPLFSIRQLTTRHQGRKQQIAATA
jgi:hypothetical protein